MSLNKMISNRLDAIISPVRSELRLAQEQAIERIQNVIVKAETEVAEKGRFMTQDQRMQKALSELEKAEEQMLSALSSMVKALAYIAPQNNLLTRFSPIKDIEGTIVQDAQSESNRLKLGFFSWKK